MLTRVPFSQVTITDSFWSPRIATNCEVTTWACIKKCVETGRVENFMNAGKSIKGEPHGEFQGLLYNDSDVYKVIEGIAYVLGNQANAQLEAAADEIITAIASAQHPDGYINTYFTLVLPDKRWTDMMYHEMYCIGHMIEAAIAYRETTDKELLFHVAVKAADHLYEHFLAADVHWIPGHQEIELALIKLYHATGDKRYLDLSHYLVEQR
ncbi:MAG: glycoside hydrolase family 127 protein, partial [Angelakisella sp.]